MENLEKKVIELNGMRFIAEPWSCQLSLENSEYQGKTKVLGLAKNEFLYGDVQLVVPTNDVVVRFTIHDFENDKQLDYNSPRSYYNRVFFNDFDFSIVREAYFNGLKLRLLSDFDITTFGRLRPIKKIIDLSENQDTINIG